ncbi:TOM (translocase of outer membrane) complex component [Didymosphaeria variabile]|uniref:TOM (Translocase of outer membrane) complex component n=1 Tax=Didymosphaeria variabile TaxID=1932322 RepID=A0A9W9C874_9PLEO|nr:TOM (translocase of outer membrane) complex component [Didymosphaeria variabile]KAJ4349429.1 TOM (translocase of outer membrane) complex component [Didymosphaeria variabile]
MSANPAAPVGPGPFPVTLPPAGSSSLWDRVSSWASEHKGVVYTVAGLTLVVSAGGVIYYLSDDKKDTGSPSPSSNKKKTKRDKRRAKERAEKEAAKEQEEVAAEPKKASVAPAIEDELPHVDESTVGSLSEEERKEYAAKLKAAGNKAYGSKDYNRAIDLYGQALLCKQDPVFYSNRAACWNAMSNWDKVIEDTTAAINLDNEYVKALNRRANAYEQVDRNSEALLDYTASCIIDGFRNESSAQSVERLLKKVAETKGKAILAQKEKKLPSPTFVTNYLQSFRPKPPPYGLDDDAELDEESNKGQLRKGLRAMSTKTAEGYAEAAAAFEKALELGDLGEHESFAYNMRGTFRYLKGDNEDALKDMDKSVELQQSLTQSFIKRASMHLELANPAAAEADFEAALAQNKDDPDIYYHRAQLHFIKAEFGEAAKDYQKSIDLDKDFIFSHIQLGVTQYKMGSIASSMATFRRCMKNFPQVPDVYNYYGELLLDQQKYQEAIEKFDTAVEMEQQNKPLFINVLPLINKALALFQWKNDFAEAEQLCQKALIIDPECDIAVATMAQLLLQQGKVTEALKYFERAAELSRTEGEIVNALSYAEATRTQLEVQEKYPRLASRLGQMGAGLGAGMR